VTAAEVALVVFSLYKLGVDIWIYIVQFDVYPWTWRSAPGM